VLGIKSRASHTKQVGALQLCIPALYAVVMEPLLVVAVTLPWGRWSQDHRHVLLKLREGRHIFPSKFWSELVFPILQF
jgi:hypothetical protein